MSLEGWEAVRESANKSLIAKVNKAFQKRSCVFRYLVAMIEDGAVLPYTPGRCSKGSSGKLAKKFGMDITMIHLIVSRKNWKHI